GVSPVTTAARRNLYADAFNEVVLMRPGQWLSRALVFFDNRGVDGVVNGAAAGFGGGSARLRRLQTGFVRSYALSMLGGTIALVLVTMSVLLVPAVILASWNALDSKAGAEEPSDRAPRRRSVKNYFGLILLLEFFMIGVFTAMDVFLFYVFFEAMLVPMYFII